MALLQVNIYFNLAEMRPVKKLQVLSILRLHPIGTCDVKRKEIEFALKQCNYLKVSNARHYKAPKQESLNFATDFKTSKRN